MAAAQTCANPTQTSTPQACSLLGDVGCTTVVSSEFSYNHEISEAKGGTLATNRHIYGPFEAGFSSMQDNIIEGWGCSNPSDVYDTEGGKDLGTATNEVAALCNVQLPRISGDSYIGIVGMCGGHTGDYHFHGSFSCLYELTGTHSTKVGDVGNGNIYGEWEDYEQKHLPLLDACGGHFGETPDSSGASVYHYHVQRDPPFTLGCYGPNAQGGLVTVEQCRALYPTKCTDASETFVVGDKQIEYSRYCPCWDANGLNTGAIEELPAIAATDNYYSAEGWTCRNDVSCLEDATSGAIPTSAPSTDATSALGGGFACSVLLMATLSKALFA